MPLPAEVEAEVDLERSTLLLIDMQRRHLDVGGVGYHTLPADRAELVVRRGGVALAAARAANVPVVHVGTGPSTGMLTHRRRRRRCSRFISALPSTVHGGATPPVFWRSHTRLV